MYVQNPLYLTQYWHFN